ncbi:MAG: hypothetical protein J0M12_14890 [Deltaproteobacteria bacterium]|nr:hypothetical protein [Deltaproteobacteria bacterium]
MDFEIENPHPPQATPESSKTELNRAKLRPQVSATTPADAPKFPVWRAARWLARACLYIGLALYVGGKYYVAKFDDKLDIDRNVRRDPTQEPLRKTPFPFEYGGHHYQIQPVAAYDISGLVVSRNNISSVFDAYHTKDSVDFRDICLVWGSNVGSGVFRKFKFWSMPWSCHYQTEDRAALDSFNESQISNNHLLSADPAIREKISKMEIGDQVRLQGFLINYWPQEASELARRTSTTRDDRGNGACEVLWVEHAEFLRRGGTNWHLLETVGGWLLVTAAALSAALFFLTPLGEYRKFRD